MPKFISSLLLVGLLTGALAAELAPFLGPEFQDLTGSCGVPLLK